MMVIAVLLQQGYQLLHHRKKIADYEVDLVMKSRTGQILILEVKSGGRSLGFGRARWEISQKLRFQKVIQTVQRKYPMTNVTGTLALVCLERVEFFYLDEV